jgi:5,10-methylenetetrahydromethanopterin reductase
MVRQVEAIARAGAMLVEFGTPLGPDPAAALRLIGEHVLPAFDD